MSEPRRTLERMPSGGGGELDLPTHERLRHPILEEITTGRLKPGDMFPPEYQLAEKYDVARSTVRQAMAELQRGGLIKRTRGKGTVIQKVAGLKLRAGLDLFALVVPQTQDAEAFYPSL